MKKESGSEKIKQKVVKIYAPSKKFVEGKEKKLSCADFLIKRFDAVG